MSISLSTSGLTVDGTTVTVGQVASAIKALPALTKALEDLYHGTASFADYEAIGLDVLTAAAIIDPALAPEVSLISALAPLMIQGFASGLIKGDPDPIHDAQTTRNFDPGDPDARL